MTDQDDLLLALGHLRGSTTNIRPSVQQAGLSYLPEWDRDRLFDALEALLADGMVMNPTPAMLNVDLTSAGQKRIAALTAPPVPHSITIGTAINSPVQQVSNHSTATQTVTYKLDRGPFENFVAFYRTHADDLALDSSSRRKADAQVATIEAQLVDDEPNPVILKEAGRSVRTIIEGAVGSLLATAVSSPAAWAAVISGLS